MGIERHNWGYAYPFDNNLLCVTMGGRRGLSRVSATCTGCGASLPRDAVNKAQDSIGQFNSENWEGCQLLFDDLWHEKYRPMADLCCMVEEADGTT